MDELRKKSDKELKKIEDEIERIYKDAEDDLKDKWDKYMSRAEKRVEGAEKALQDAMKTGDADAIAAAKAALTQKKQAVFFRDKQFSEMVDAVTDRIANVNQLAADYVNGQMPAMYRYNYNGSLREVQKDAEASGIGGIAFNMIDDATVARMQKQGEVTLPKRKIDVPKDKQWNKKAINAQMMQGIIQGESIPQMSKRLREVTDMNKTSSIRNARTMTTEAENGGRLDSMKEAEDMGLEYEKTWLASHDDRTRLSHALLDGETVGLDEPFSNGLQYPADPSGPPEEVYNCRCSLVRKLVGFKGKHIDAAGYEPTYFADAQQAAEANPPTETELHETADEFEEEIAASNSWIIDETPLPPQAYEFTNVNDYRAANAAYREKYGDDAYYNGREAQEQHETQWGGLSFDPEEREKQIQKMKRIDDTATRLQTKYELPQGTNNFVIGEYDSVQSRLTEIQQSRADIAEAAGQTWNNPNTGEVVIGFNINATSSASFEKELKDRAEAIASGKQLDMVFPNQSAEGLTIHEFGHVMDEYFDNAFVHDDENARAYWEWYKSLTPEEIMSGVSTYAAVNRGEFAAECFCELQTENPRPIARKFGEFFEKVYGKSWEE